MIKHNNYAIMITKTLTIIAVVATIFFAAMLFNTRNDDVAVEVVAAPDTCQGVMETDLGQSISAASNSQVLGEELDRYADEPSFDNSAVCMYLTTFHNVGIGRPTKSRETLDKLKNIDSAESSYSKIINNSLSLAQLEDLVAGIEKQTEQIYINAQKLPAL
jgi:hypothetical protein